MAILLNICSIKENKLRIIYEKNNIGFPGSVSRE